MQAWMRPAGAGLVVLGVVLLVIGFAASSDLLGFLSMVSVVAGVAILVGDLVMRRRAA